VAGRARRAGAAIPGREVVRLVQHAHTESLGQRRQVVFQSFTFGANLPYVVIAIKLGKEQRAAVDRFRQPKPSAFANDWCRDESEIFDGAEIAAVQSGDEDAFSYRTGQGFEIDQKFSALEDRDEWHRWGWRAGCKIQTNRRPGRARERRGRSR
jgi:hypothetical protein